VLGDGRLHFIHQRSRHAEAFPLVITHGWPGSIVEFYKIIGPLTDPTAHGGDGADAFHVVCPSIPGYGFSDPPRARGFDIRKVAETNVALMKALGYAAYGAQGGDWGAMTSSYGAWLDFLRGRLSTYIHRLPVDQSFTCAAGRAIWGFPKTVERIELAVDGGHARCRLEMDGRLVLTLDAPATGSRALSDNAMLTYSMIDGTLHRTPFRSGADEVGMQRGGATLTLGDHSVADELRALGLPKPALFSVWMGHMRGRFDAAMPVEG